MRIDKYSNNRYKIKANQCQTRQLFSWCAHDTIMTLKVASEKNDGFIPESKGLFLGKRHIQFVLMFLIIIIDYGIRTSMSVGILSMMDAKQTNPNIPTYPYWTLKEEIISSFFWGYVIPQIGAGAIVKRWGPKWPLLITTTINCLFCILVPVMAANLNETGVIICRVFQGLTQGFLFPSLHNLLSKWTSLPERSTVISIVYTGGPLGNVIVMPITGWISGSSVGWPLVFYLYGSLGLLWACIFVFVGANSPQAHGGVSQEERDYIESGMGAVEDLPHEPTPWKAILTSWPFWAILIAHSGHNWGFWTLLTEIPTYMEKIMLYKLSDNSLLSALPYLALFFINMAFSPIADYLIVKQILSIGTTRKLFNSIGLIIPAIALICLAFVGQENRTLAISLLIVAVGINAGIYCGFNVNHIDISPNHAGVLMGFTNSISNIFSIIAPFAFKIIPREESDPILWRYVFLITAAFYLISNTFYVIFASGDVQTWNSIYTQNKDGEKKKKEQMEKV